MGQQVSNSTGTRGVRLFEKALLNDVRALEIMLERGLVESGVCRIGAEQELFLVDESFLPCPKSLEILEVIKDPNVTTELGSFNLEFNVPPLEYGTNCLSALEEELERFISKIRRAANKQNADVVLTGILPTLKKSDLTLDNLTPKPRYFSLNEAVTKLRGKQYDLFLRGIDELYVKHDSVMLEACNTSFQVHFQVSPEDFAKYYNIAQVVAAPTISLSANSPLMFGRRLWNETRIAVFQQSTDTRNSPRHLRRRPARVHFGSGWVKESVLEILKEDIARFRVLLAVDLDEDSMRALDAGQTPFLKALQLHNSTVYRWTRPCYGITDGKPHLRIENRLFPSGPTVVDEVANAAFWLGVINGMASLYEDISKEIDFDEAKGNFYAAARGGLRAQFTWMNQRTIPAQELIRSELLPLARDGLLEAGLDGVDIDRYLGVVRDRVDSWQTGAEWMLRSFNESKKHESVDKSLYTITKSIYRNQKQGQPVHEWPLAKVSRGKDITKHYLRVEQLMSTDLFTVNQDDTVDLVINVMNWRRIRHIPVEDSKDRLVGLVNYRSLVRLIQGLGKKQKNVKDYSIQPVSTIMRKQVPVVSPRTSTLEAIALMRKHGVSCLPVVSENRLVGIVTEHDFMNLTARFIESGLD